MAGIWPHVSLLSTRKELVDGRIQARANSSTAFISDLMNGSTFKFSSTSQAPQIYFHALPRSETSSTDLEELKVSETGHEDTTSIVHVVNITPSFNVSNWASFLDGRPVPHSSGRWLRSDDQIDLNLLQGEYEKIQVPWLRNFASRSVPHKCPASGVLNEPKVQQILDHKLSKELLIVHSVLTTAEINLNGGKVTDEVRDTYMKIQSQTLLDARALVTTADGPFDTCAALTTATACEGDRQCVLIAGLGPCCTLHLTYSSRESSGSRRNSYNSSTKDDLASILLWPSGLGQAEDRLTAFNSAFAPLISDSNAVEMSTGAFTHHVVSLSVALRLNPVGMVVCFARDNILPSGSTLPNSERDVHIHDNGSILDDSRHLGDNGVAWVTAAARLLRRNKRLAVASCFPKYPGNSYVDAPDYFHVPFKLLTYGLGLEDCAEADSDASLKFHSPFVMKDASGSTRERFAYVPFSPYGPQCYDVDSLRAALPQLDSSIPFSAKLFRDTDERPQGVGAEVDLHLRLWRDGNASVGLLDCGLEEPFPQEEVFPSGAGLIADNATKYAPSNLLQMTKTMLLNMQSKNEIAEPATAIAAREVQLAVALANHRLFQQRQALLWPQATALDNAYNHKRDEPIPMMAQAGCQAFASDLPLRQYGDPTEGLTLVLMSYAGGVGGGRLKHLLQHYFDNFSRDLLKEIVLVWNSPKDSLPSDIQGMTQSTTHQGALRIVCFDTNSLLNRFHPRVAPKTRAIVFGDDDRGMVEASLRIGYLKWCCGNADRAVGVIGRRFGASKSGITYHANTRMHDLQMVLPTGMIIDRGYLCHFWRRAFKPLHDFVNYSPSKPDDIATNLLIQYLSGKGPRNYPQVVDQPGQLPAVKRRRSLRTTRHLQQPRQYSLHKEPERHEHWRQHYHDRIQHQQRNLHSASNTTTPTGTYEKVAGAHSMVSQSNIRRRRLGMAGSAPWSIWRSDATLWASYFFGGVPRVSPGYCNEGIPVENWTQNCDSTIAIEDLPTAYGIVAAITANDRNLTKLSGTKIVTTKPVQLLQGVGTYHGPKVLPWLASCNASALFHAQETRLKKDAQARDNTRRQGTRHKLVKPWVESVGLLLSTTASTAKDGGPANSKTQDVWDTIRNIAAKNPEVQIVVTGMRNITLRNATKLNLLNSIDTDIRQQVFLRDKVAMRRQSLIVETIPSLQTSNTTSEALGVASEASIADESSIDAENAQLFLDALLRGLDDGSLVQAFNHTTWLDPAMVQPCKKTLIPVPWLRTPATRRSHSPSASVSPPNASGVMSEAAAKYPYDTVSATLPWVLWADFTALAAPGEIRGSIRKPRPVAAGWTYADAVSARIGLEALRTQWARKGAMPELEEVKLALQEAGWEHIAMSVPSARTRDSTARSTALPGACSRGNSNCPPNESCNCPFPECRVLLSRK